MHCSMTRPEASAQMFGLQFTDMELQPLGEMNDLCRLTFLIVLVRIVGWSGELQGASRTGTAWEANRRGDGDWRRNALSARQGGFQNSGKGFLNLVRMPSRRIKCNAVVG